LALTSSSADTALSDLWAALADPTQQRARRALLALGAGAAPATRAAIAAALRRRRDSAQELLEQLFACLAFTPRVAPSTLAVAYLAFADGLSLQPAVQPDGQQRQAFDAFWLAVLSLEGG
jgi:hypothetical protein